MEQSQKNIIIRLLEKAKGLKNMFKNHKSPTIIAYPILSMLIILATTFLSNTYISNSSHQTSQVEGVTTKDIELLESKKPSPYIEPVVTPAPDPNPVITCTSSAPECSGQSIKLRQSACSNIICCQVVAGGKWSAYPSREQCIKDQNAAQLTPQPTAQTAPAKEQTTKTTNTVTKKDVEQMITQNDIEAAKRQLKNDAYSNCLASARIESDRCFKECGDKNSFNSNACDATYLYGDNFNSEQYQLCNTERNAQNTECNDKCFAISNKCQP